MPRLFQSMGGWKPPTFDLDLNQALTIVSIHGSLDAPNALCRVGKQAFEVSIHGDATVPNSIAPVIEPPPPQFQSMGTWLPPMIPYPSTSTCRTFQSMGTQQSPTVIIDDHFSGKAVSIHGDMVAPNKSTFFRSSSRPAFQSAGAKIPPNHECRERLTGVRVSIRGGGDGREGPAAPDRSKHHLLLTIFLKASLNSR